MRQPIPSGSRDTATLRHEATERRKTMSRTTEPETFHRDSPGV